MNKASEIHFPSFPFCNVITPCKKTIILIQSN